MLTPKKSPAVTLVELSIALVIIGILVVASVSGVTIINNTKATSTINILKDRNTQFTVFESLYDCIPGDCKTASRQISGIYVDPIYGVAEGNGNGCIDRYPTQPIININIREANLAEYHLYMSGISRRTIPTDGLFFGRGNPNDDLIDNTLGAFAVSEAILSQNKLQFIFPKLPISKAYVSSITTASSPILGGTVLNVPSGKHYNIIGGLNNITLINIHPLTSYNILSQIDQKIDDGIYNTGSIFCANIEWLHDNGDTAGLDHFVGTFSPYIQPCVMLQEMNL